MLKRGFSRMAFREVLRLFRRREYNQRYAVIVGAGKLGQRLVECLSRRSRRSEPGRAGDARPGPPRLSYASQSLRSFMDRSQIASLLGHQLTAEGGHRPSSLVR